MDYLIKSSILLGIIYLIHRFFLRSDSLFTSHRWFLLFGLLLSCLIPLIVIPNYVEYISTPHIAFDIDASNVTEAEHIPHQSRFDYSALLITLYYSTVIFFLLRLIFNIASFFKLIKSYKTERRNGILFVEIDKKIQPFSFLNYIVYNPAMHNAVALEAILEHEKIHVKHAHTIDVLLLEVYLAFFWFNPFAWLHRAAMKQNLEYIADQHASKNSDDINNYCKLLVKSTVTNHGNFILNKFYNSEIKKRIVMLHKPKSNQLYSLKYLIVLPILAIFLMSFNTKTIYVEKSVPQQQTQDTIEYWNVLKFTINKNTSDKQIEVIKSKLEENDGVSINFAVKRNEQDKLKSINVVFSSEESNGNYMHNDSEAFKPISIAYDVTGKRFTISSNSSANLSTTIQLPEKRVRIPMKTDTVVREKQQKKDELKSRLKVINADSVRHIGSERKVMVKNMDDISIAADTILLDEMRNFQWVSSDGTKTRIIASENGNSYSYAHSGLSDALVIVNGDIINYSDLVKLDTNNIQHINILKGEQAISIHGEKAKHGVIIITTKDVITNSIGKDGKVVTLNNFVYKSDKGRDKDGATAYIFKHTNRKELDSNAFMLEKIGLNVVHSKIKRNKNGEIIRIKITIKDNNGKSTSASYNTDDGIPKIKYGISEGDLFIQAYGK